MRNLFDRCGICTLAIVGEIMVLLACSKCTKKSYRCRHQSFAGRIVREHIGS